MTPCVRLMPPSRERRVLASFTGDEGRRVTIAMREPLWPTRTRWASEFNPIQVIQSPETATAYIDIFEATAVALTPLYRFN